MAFAPALREALAQATGEPVELRETHISWIFLARGLAFKLKKPVRLPFLDFGTPQARRRACEDELRLNRRLAPTLYLALVEVRGTPDAPTVGGHGPAIDTLVCMRRFAD